MIKTAIVILNWNGIGWLKKYLPDVVRFSTRDDVKIYVADNNSDDGSVSWVSENISDAEIIRLDKNYGFAGGYNRALAEIDSKYFVLLNSDVNVTPGWLIPMEEFMDKNPGVASCQPKIMSAGNKEYFEYAGAAGGFIDKFGYPFCRGRIFDVVEKDEGQYNDNIDVFWSSGACMMVRSEAWQKCGGLDDDFFAHMEEIDLCWRFHLAGWRVSYLPGSVVYHAGGGSLPYESEFKTYLNFRNNLYMLYKNLPDNKKNSIIFKKRLLDGIAAIFFLLKGKPGNVRAVFKAHRHFLGNIAMLNEKRKAVKALTSTNNNATLVNKSIVYRFYVKGQKTYNSLFGKNK